MKPTRAEIDEVGRLVRRTLVSYSQNPSDEAIDVLIDSFTAHGQRYVARARRTDAGAWRVTTALDDWDALIVVGPGSEPLANWDHARSLARIVRTLHNALLEEGRRHEAVSHRQVDA